MKYIMLMEIKHRTFSSSIKLENVRNFFVYTCWMLIVWPRLSHIECNDTKIKWNESISSRIGNEWETRPPIYIFYFTASFIYELRFTKYCHVHSIAFHFINDKILFDFETWNLIRPSNFYLICITIYGIA